MRRVAFLCFRLTIRDTCKSPLARAPSHRLVEVRGWLACPGQTLSRADLEEGWSPQVYINSRGSIFGARRAPSLERPLSLTGTDHRGVVEWSLEQVFPEIRRRCSWEAFSYYEEGGVSVFQTNNPRYV